MTALIIGEPQKAAIAALRQLASERPVDIIRLRDNIDDPAFKAEHMDRMTEQTIELPVAFRVTYSLETNQPAGTCRHMSMSVSKRGKLPSPEAVWMVAEEFGFVGALTDCAVWIEELLGHGRAINIVQPVM